jgi:hypothetical protein
LLEFLASLFNASAGVFGLNCLGDRVSCLSTQNLCKGPSPPELLHEQHKHLPVKIKMKISLSTFSIQLTMTNNKKFTNSISHPIYFDLIKISVNDNFSSFVKVFGILTVTGVN